MTDRPSLLKVVPAPVIEQGDGSIQLDVKFLEGMRVYRALWPGPITCLMRRGVTSIAFPTSVRREDLDFEIVIMDPGKPVSPDILERFDIVSCSGDMQEELELWRSITDRSRTKLVYSIEYTLGTRLRIMLLDKHRNVARKLSGALWTLRSERRRRRAFRHADGLQVNGYPGFVDYAAKAGSAMLYLDNRMTDDLFATAKEMEARRAHLMSGAPLRMIHSGRLEPMKGAQDLIPIARALEAMGVRYTLDIYGDGSLRPGIQREIEARGLQSHVRLHQPVDFATGLVPAARHGADLFLSCHRQSDPSCTYVESMGCGLPIVGYRNRMWMLLNEAADAGWAVPLGNVNAMAQQIARLDRNRDAIVAKADQALAFAHSHAFEPEFQKRMDHLLLVANS